MYLLWASTVFFHSFLLAWVLQLVITRVGTSGAIRKARHFMIGVIAGELAGGLLWILVGAIYHTATGLRPPAYGVFPY